MTVALENTPEVLPRSELNLVWIDCEMTGLDPEAERLIEIAVIVTGPNKGTHGRSGLIDKVKASTVSEEDAQAQILEFLARYVPKGTTPMCGNTISQDRRFLVKYMPKMEAFFHYRNLDVSTLKELARRWRPEVYSAFKKQQKHTALADVHESIDELVHYREHFLKMEK